MFLREYTESVKRLYRSLKEKYSLSELLTKGYPRLVKVVDDENPLGSIEPIRDIVSAGGFILHTEKDPDDIWFYYVVPKYFPDARELAEFVKSHLKLKFWKILNLYDIERGTDYYELIDRWFTTENGDILLCYEVYTNIYASIRDNHLYVSEDHPYEPENGDRARVFA